MSLKKKKELALKSHKALWQMYKEYKKRTTDYTGRKYISTEKFYNGKLFNSIFLIKTFLFIKT